MMRGVEIELVFRVPGRGELVRRWGRMGRSDERGVART
jgi:hypothetical protein